MPGMYFFNCNGPVQGGPFGNCSEARQDAENRFGGGKQRMNRFADDASCRRLRQQHIRETSAGQRIN